MTQATPLIEFREATIWRGSTCVFERLNLKIAQHSQVVVLGPNGSGKTTLLKTINREIYPVVRDGSSVRILGRERWNVWDLRRSIGIVSDDLQRRYADSTPAREVVLSGFHSSIGVQGVVAAAISDEEVRAATRVIEDVGLGEDADTPLRKLSTGQQRRCLLARALVHQPHTLILDEPTAGLDFAASFRMQRQLARLAASGRSIVIATHHLSDIPRDVDRVILLDRGRIAADGPAAKVLTAENLSDVYRTPIRVATVEGHYLAYPDMSGS